MKEPRDSIWRLRLDLASARALMLLGSSPADEDLNPDVHLFLYDRYSRLAALHEAAGRRANAAALRGRAQYHFGFCAGGPQTDPDRADRPSRPPVRILAFGGQRRSPRDDAA